MTNPLFRRLTDMIGLSASIETTLPAVADAPPVEPAPATLSEDQIPSTDQTKTLEMELAAPTHPITDREQALRLVVAARQADPRTASDLNRAMNWSRLPDFNKVFRQGKKPTDRFLIALCAHYGIPIAIEPKFRPTQSDYPGLAAERKRQIGNRGTAPDPAAVQRTYDGVVEAIRMDSRTNSEICRDAGIPTSPFTHLLCGHLPRPTVLAKLATLYGIPVGFSADATAYRADLRLQSIPDRLGPRAKKTKAGLADSNSQPAPAGSPTLTPSAQEADPAVAKLEEIVSAARSARLYKMQRDELAVQLKAAEQRAHAAEAKLSQIRAAAEV